MSDIGMFARYQRETKLVIVMRKDLGMRKGKMIAQGGHASVAFLTSKMRGSCFAERNAEGQLVAQFPEFRSVILTEAEQAWIEGSFKKICVGVKDETELLEIHEAALKAQLVSIPITDKGDTEFHGKPTLTCIGIGPDYSDLIDKVTGHLKLL